MENLGSYIESTGGGAYLEQLKFILLHQSLPHSEKAKIDRRRHKSTQRIQMEGGIFTNCCNTETCEICT